MKCDVCKKRDRCITICTYMEKYLSKFEAKIHDLQLNNDMLLPLVEKHLEEKQAIWMDKHSCLLPELTRALESLPARQRAIIEFYYFEGLSVDQISRRLKVGKSNVSIRLKNALYALKRAMKVPNF